MHNPHVPSHRSGRTETATAGKEKRERVFPSSTPLAEKSAPYLTMWEVQCATNFVTRQATKYHSTNGAQTSHIELLHMCVTTPGHLEPP